MNRSIDARTEMRKIVSSKPFYAAAGMGVLASQTLRKLPARLVRWRGEADVASLPARASGYVTGARARAAERYDRLADRGKRALNGRAVLPGKDGPTGKGESR